MGNNMFASRLNRPTTYTDDNGQIASNIENEITPDGASIIGKKTIPFEKGTVSVVVVVEYDEIPIHMMQLSYITALFLQMISIWKSSFLPKFLSSYFSMFH